MKHHVLGPMMAMAAVVAVVLVTPVPAAGQAPAASRWNPPRLPDGQPDMQGLWTSPGGATPDATLYASILRDLRKGKDARFKKTDRGQFTLASK